MTTTSGTAASALPVAGGSSSSTLSEWAGPYVTSMLGRAQALADQPYYTYQGPMTAGASALQSKMFQGLGNLAFPNLGGSFSSTGAYAPPTLSGAPGAGGTPGIAAQYMNPYLQSVLTPQLDEMRRQHQISQQGLQSQFARAGAFGGSRDTLARTEGLRNLASQQANLVGQAYSSAFDRGQQQFNIEQQQKQALANMLSAAGQQQRGIEQEGITADYNEFLQQRDYPMRQVQFLQSMLQGMPISTVTNTPAQMSGLGSLTSSIGGLGTLLEQLRRFPSLLGGGN